MGFQLIRPLKATNLEKQPIHTIYIVLDFMVARLYNFKFLNLQLCLQRWEQNYYRNRRKLNKDTKVVTTWSAHFIYFGENLAHVHVIDEGVVYAYWLVSSPIQLV